MSDEIVKEEVTEPMNQENDVPLELGDIIRIQAPKNKKYHDYEYKVDYLDNNQIKIINIKTFEKETINIVDNTISDESIEKILILYKNPKKGYAAQHDLETGENITIVFGGIQPAIINGTITNVENDMIELKIYPSDKLIYIDFAYKGIPLNLPIEKIKPFDKLSIVGVEEEGEKDDEIEDGEREGEEGEDKSLLPDDDAKIGEREELVIQDIMKPKKDIRDKITKQINEARQIYTIEIVNAPSKFIEYEVDVPEEKKRYTLKTQVDDLLEQLGSTDENDEDIHLNIARFQELRQDFSDIKDGVVVGYLKNGKHRKPMVDSLMSNFFGFKWFIPIFKTDTKIQDKNDKQYGKNFKVKTYENELLDLLENENKMKKGTINQATYEYNSNKWHRHFTMPSNLEDTITSIKYDNAEKIPSDALIANNLNLNFASLKGDGIVNGKFCQQRILPGDTMQFFSSIILPHPFIRGNIGPMNNIYRKTNQNLLGIINVPNMFLRDSERSNRTFNQINTFQIKEQSDPKYAKEQDGGGDIYSQSSTSLSRSFDTIKQLNFEPVRNYGERGNMEVALRNYFHDILPSTEYLLSIAIDPYLTSFTKYMEFLSNFDIYYPDLHASQFFKLQEKIMSNIDNIKKKYYKNASRIKRYNQIIKKSVKNKTFSPLTTVFKENPEFSNVLELYDINKMNGKLDIISLINSIDNGNLFHTAITLSNMITYQPIDIEDLLEKSAALVEGDDDGNEIDDESGENCRKKHFLAKRYIDYDDLRDDDDQEIYFDDQYKKRDIFGNNDDNFEETTIKDERGNPIVEDGHFAVLNVEDEVEEYYIRKDSVWEKYDVLNGENPSINFCNTRSNCLNVKRDCNSIQDNRSKIKKAFTEHLMEYVKQEYFTQSKDMKAILNNKFKKYIAELERKRKWEKEKRMSGEKIKMDIAKNYKERRIKTSPYAEALDLILGELDFVKRQKEIITFAQNFCRDYNYANDENKYWLYCNSSDLKLLPTFFVKLANAYFQGRYNEELDLIESRQGRLSDAGDKIVDKWSGYTISNIKYDENEGFDDKGFVMRTREIMEKTKEEQISDFLTSQDEVNQKHEKSIQIFASLEHEKQKKDSSSLALKQRPVYNEEIKQTISDIVYDLKGRMKITVEIDDDFIIEGVENATTIMKKYRLINKRKYNKGIEEKMKKNKGKTNYPTYDEYRAQIILKLTMMFYIIALQTNETPIKIKDGYDGCEKSFSGFPLEENNNVINYVLCVAQSFASSVKSTKRGKKDKKGNETKAIENLPWGVIPKLSKSTKNQRFNKYKTKFRSNFEELLKDDEIRKKIPNIQIRLERRRQYLKDTMRIIEKDKSKSMSMSSKESDKEGSEGREGREEHNMWGTFMPPLKPIKQNNIRDVSPNFAYTLLKNVRTDGEVNKKLNVIKGKINTFSIAIQHSIQEIVKREPRLLNTFDGTPYLENSCCNGNQGDEVEPAIKYFSNLDKQIEVYNSKVSAHRRSVENIMALLNPPSLISTTNNKLSYPPLSDKLSEDTLYAIYIKHCGMDGKIAFEKDFRGICQNKNMGLGEKIKLLKAEEAIVNENITRKLLQKNNLRNLTPIMSTSTSISVSKDTHLKKILSNKIKRATLLEQKNSLKAPVIREHIKIMKSLNNYIRLKTAGIREIIMSDIETSTKKMSEKVTTFFSFYTDETPVAINRKMNQLDKWNYDAENVILSSDDERGFFMSDFYMKHIKSLSIINPAKITSKSLKMFKTGDDYEIEIPESWKSWGLSARHEKDIQNILNETNSLYNKFYNLEKEFGKYFDSNLSFIQTHFADIVEFLTHLKIFSQLDGSILFDGILLSKLHKYFYFSIMVAYIEGTEYDERENEDSEQFMSDSDDSMIESEEEGEGERGKRGKREKREPKKEIIEIKDIGLSMMSEEEDMYKDVGKLKGEIAEFLWINLNSALSHKKTVDYSKQKMEGMVRKIKDKEKEAIKRKFKEMDKTNREIENLKKNLRLGEWGLGQTNAVFKYDADQYDKERHQIDQMIQDESKYNNLDEVSRMYMGIYDREDWNAERRLQREIDEDNELFIADDDGDSPDLEYYD